MGKLENTILAIIFSAWESLLRRKNLKFFTSFIVFLIIIGTIAYWKKHEIFKPGY